jgi:hypothetical protein
MEKALESIKVALLYKDAKNLSKTDIHVVNNKSFYLINRKVSWKAIKLIKKQVSLVNSK